MRKALNFFNRNREGCLTYGLVVIFYIIMQTLSSQGALSRSVSGYLVPICVYIVLAVSLNLVVGISGELSLGHAWLQPSVWAAALQVLQDCWSASLF